MVPPRSGVIRSIRRFTVYAAALAALLLAPAPAHGKPPFAPGSFWNKALPASAPLDAGSKQYVGRLRDQLQTAQPWINTTEYSTPVFTAGRHEPRTRVRLDVADAVPDLQRSWESVPIPRGARPARGADGHMVIHQPSTDTLWEFWQARRSANGWHARWGGTMKRVSRNPGYFNSPNSWGATATGLPLLGGLIRIREAHAGRIDHALALAIPSTKAEKVAWPAQRTDGSSKDRWAIPEGTRFRLDPRLDLSERRMLPLVRAMARAAQKYGIVVRDQAPAVAFVAEDPTPTGTNPFAGPSGFFKGGYINQILREQFPWDKLQTLPVRTTCCWRAPEQSP